MVDWYKAMADLGNENASSYRELKLSSRVLKIIGIVLLLLCMVHGIRLWTGSVSWLGMVERNVRTAPEWMHTPVSTNTLSDGMGLPFPMFAWGGQEIVLHYTLSSRLQNAKAPYARILISCYCKTDNWGYFRIDSPGSGEFVMPAHSANLYSVSIKQSPGPTGEGSVGTYYWGVRTARSGDRTAH